MSQKRSSNLEIFKQERSLNQNKKCYQKNGVVYFQEPLTITEFSNTININAPELVSFFFRSGKIYNINQNLDAEDILAACTHFKLKCQEGLAKTNNFFEKMLLLDSDDNLQMRPPVVTIMGHVNHGKTTLLDYLCKKKLTAQEAGGITQKTAAYQVKTSSKNIITFLDTPGHEAFTAMRARGAQVTDIVVLVVAANENLKPQTQEAWDHIKAAKVAVIVFLNKMDRPGADPERITQELMQIGIVPDTYGGHVPFVSGSALTGEGVEELVELISLQAEVLKLQANPNKLASGTVLECSLDRGKGALLTLLIRSGILLKRDFLVIGKGYGRVRSLSSTTGTPIEQASPGTPCLVSGFNFCPMPGEVFIGVENEKEAQQLATKEGIQETGQPLFTHNKSELKNLNLIIKTDNQGSAEALKNALRSLKNSEAQVNILRAATGELNQADILLAVTSKAHIFCFATKISNEAKQLAKEQKVNVTNAKVIYEIIEVVKKLLCGLKTPTYKSVLSGEAVILKLFYYSKVGNIAGCSMVEGYVTAGAKVQVVRRGKLHYEGQLDSLRRSTNDVKKVEKGFEFGCHIQGYDDIKVDDTLKFFEDVLVEDED